MLIWHQLALETMQREWHSLRVAIRTKWPLKVAMWGEWHLRVANSTPSVGGGDGNNYHYRPSGWPTTISCPPSPADTKYIVYYLFKKMLSPTQRNVFVPLYLPSPSSLPLLHSWPFPPPCLFSGTIKLV